MHTGQGPATTAAKIVFGGAVIFGYLGGMGLPANAAVEHHASVRTAPVDSDSDGMPNRWELRHNLNVHLANAKANPDHDKLTNLAELKAGTNPHVRDTNHDGTIDGVTPAVDDEATDDQSDSTDDQSDSTDDGTDDSQ